MTAATTSTSSWEQKHRRRSASRRVAQHAGSDPPPFRLQSDARPAKTVWRHAASFSCPPAGVGREAVGDGSGLEISLSVNGEQRQRGNTSEMTRPIPELVAAISRWMTLERGDVILTGTPAGVGPVAPGDRVEASIERVGDLSFQITAAPGEDAD